MIYHLARGCKILKYIQSASSNISKLTLTCNDPSYRSLKGQKYDRTCLKSVVSTRCGVYNTNHTICCIVCSQFLYLNPAFE